MEEFKKLAGKSSNDPKQQELREHKNEFNKEVSLLIAQMIAFKRGINGRGEPRVGIPPSDIKNPLPKEINQYLEQMTGRFEKVVQESRDLISEQEEYAKTRRKGRKEILSNINDQFIKEASWWGSRLWAYMKYSPRLWNKQLKLRMSMLWVSADVSNGLLDLENFLVSSDENAIPRAFHNFTQMRNHITGTMCGTLLEILDLSSQAAENPPPETKELEKPTSIPQPLRGNEEENLQEESRQEELKQEQNLSSWDPNINWSKIDEIQQDLPKAQNVLALLVAKSLITQDKSKELLKTLRGLIKIAHQEIGLNKLSKKYLESPDASAAFLKTVNFFYKEYDSLLGVLGALIDGNVYISFDQMVESLEKNATAEEAVINKLAHNWLTRTLKRWKLNILPSFTDKIRLTCVKMVIALHEEFGDLQDLLEKSDNNIVVVANKMVEILGLFEKLADKMLILADNHNSEYEEIRLDEKKVDMRPITAQSISIMRKSKLTFGSVAGKISGKLEALEGVVSGDSKELLGESDE